MDSRCVLVVAYSLLGRRALRNQPASGEGSGGRTAVNRRAIPSGSDCHPERQRNGSEGSPVMSP